MKHFAILLLALLMSMSASAYARTTSEHAVETVSIIPDNLVVKQTITFNDGKVITLFYQKQGDVCKLFSKTDLSKFKEADLYRIKSSNFELVDYVDGKCIVSRRKEDILTFVADFARHLK